MAVVFMTLLVQASIAQPLYTRAGWKASLRPGGHDAQAVVTIVDEHTLQVENFTYDGTAPLVYFYLGAGNTNTDFKNGLQLDPLLDRAYADESLVLTLPAGESLDDYNAISVWCAEFAVNFSSASFVSPLSAAGDGPVGPAGFTLHPNVPNPFNPTTRISYSIPEDEFVSLAIYSVDGRVASGTYLYGLKTGESIELKKMTLVK